MKKQPLPRKLVKAKSDKCASCRHVVGAHDALGCWNMEVRNDVDYENSTGTVDQCQCKGFSECTPQVGYDGKMI